MSEQFVIKQRKKKLRSGDASVAPIATSQDAESGRGMPRPYEERAVAPIYASTPHQSQMLSAMTLIAVM